MPKFLKKTPNIVSVTGFAYSGCGAVTDLLREYDNVIVYGLISQQNKTIQHKNESETDAEMQFFLYLNLHGLYQALLEQNEVNSDIAIKRTLSNSYNLITGSNNTNCAKTIFADVFRKEKFKELFYDYLFLILDLSEREKSYISEIKDFFFPLSVKNEKYEIFNIKDNFYYKSKEWDLYRFGFVYKDYVFYKFKPGLTPYLFSKYTKDFLSGLFEWMAKGNELLVLQNFLIRTNYKKMYHILPDNFKNIIVYRDPRDMFMSRYKYGYYPEILYSNFVNRLKGYDLKRNFYDSDNTLIVKFEKLVNNPDEEVAKIEKFLNLDCKRHIYNRKLFDPMKSAKAIGIYKQFYDQNLIRCIHDELIDWCY